MSVNYDALIEITVKSQSELDMIPDDFKGRIYIEFGTYFNRAVLNRRFYRRVVARGNSSVVARGNSSVEAWENSSVVARGNSSVVARENSSVVAWENSSVVARENSSVVAWENSSVVARENSSVVAWENSSVVARENSSVEARENSSVVAWENSSVVATGNAQVVNRLNAGRGRIEVTGNARVVFMPKNIEEFMSFYGIKHDKKKAIFFKAVHKVTEPPEENFNETVKSCSVNVSYVSDYDSDFTYPIGEIVKEDCDPNTWDDCSYGIHIAHRSWCLDFGRDWRDLAIIEVETDIDKIILPDNSTGKVRTSEVKVLREVPLEECGVYGKILAKRNKEDK